MKFRRALITTKDDYKTINLPKCLTDCPGWHVLTVELIFNEQKNEIIIKPMENDEDNVEAI